LLRISQLLAEHFSERTDNWLQFVRSHATGRFGNLE